MKDVVLTGFMGTGKSTVGSLLARKYGLQFVDLDQEVERLAGRTVPEIFHDGGEAEFRRLETQALAGLPEGGGRVIAAGGGTFVSASNRDLLRSGQVVLCLQCDIEELDRRLGDRAGRPLLPNGDNRALRALLDRRRVVYDMFPTIETTGRSPEAVATDIAERLELSSAACLHVTSERTSTVLFGEGLLGQMGAKFREQEFDGHVLLITDETVAAHGWVDTLEASLVNCGCATARFVLPSGEHFKSLASLQELYGACTEHRLDRRATILAVGGGVICDLAGMLAATYLRGLRLVLLPTTLLAQVDAAIGGKVGIDFAGVKNLVGAFHPAELVVIDPTLLHTLPGRLVRDGLAEVVKIGMIRSAELVASLEGFVEPEDVLVRTDVIRRGVQAKVTLVQADPFERGERALLNFGHTVGHALEAVSEYRLSHGEAVAVGMVAESWLAEHHAWCAAGVRRQLLALLKQLDLPASAPDLKLDSALSVIGLDKKRHGSQLRVAVPTTVGEGAVFPVTDADARLMLEVAIRGVA